MPEPLDGPALFMGEQSGVGLRDWLDVDESAMAALVEGGVVQETSGEELTAVAKALTDVGEPA